MVVCVCLLCSLEGEGEGDGEGDGKGGWVNDITLTTPTLKKKV
jgi:hypothetical protein